VNYSQGEGKELLEAALGEWNSKSGRFREGMLLRTFANVVGISKSNLSRRTAKHTGESGRGPDLTGAGQGRKPLVSKKQQQLIVDVVRRHDRGNEPLTPRAVVNLVTQLVPISNVQAADHVRRTMRPNHRDEITNLVKPQATSTKRSGVTIQSQHFWHLTVDAAYEELRQLNASAMSGGVDFDDVMSSFIAGGDETCLLASEGGARVLGDKEISKHEAKSADSRVSITMYRTGTASGSTGPTGFLPAGHRVRAGFDAAFLEKHGAAPGSSIHMTPTGFMTDEAWDAMAIRQAKGCRVTETREGGIDGSWNGMAFSRGKG